MPISPIKLDTFGGELPVIDDRLLPNSQAAEAVNTWLFSGRIEPIHSLVPIHTMGANNQGVFRLPKIDPGIDYMSSSYWLEFTDPKVRVIRSPINGQDDDGRYYWADGVYPKYMTGTAIQNQPKVMRGAWNSATAYIAGDGVTYNGLQYTALIGNTNVTPGTNPATWIVSQPIHLGVPPPETAPSVTASGGSSATNTTTSYVYTWVTANGEEGAPSPPGVITYKVDGLYHLVLTAPLAGDVANRQLTKTRIYRTIVGAQGAASFFFVAEIPIAQLTYDDNHATDTDAVIVENEQLTTTYWTPPPDDLQALVTMPNGIIAAWRKNEVWFCEPYYPHAWPVTYVIGVDNDIVGLGVYDQSLIILTQGQPYSATGVDPQAMALRKIQPLEPCTSRLSIVNTPNGVLYCSPNGLINITPSGAANLTAAMLTKDQWNNRLNLPSVAAAILSSGYYAYSLGASAVFQDSVHPPDAFNAFQQDAFQQQSEFGTKAGIYLALNDQRIALTELHPLPSTVQNVLTDIFNGEIMVIRDGVVYAVDLRKFDPYAPYRWRSKIFTLPYIQNLGAAKVYFTPPYVPQLCPNTYFRVFAGETANAADDGLPLKFEQALEKSGKVLRLPSGYKALYYQFEVEGVAVIDSIHVAQTPHELREI